MYESNGTVIIVNDGENVCTLYQKALELGGFNVKAFTDPNGALEYVDKKYDQTGNK